MEQKAMKSILMSIQPKWCEKIINGEKTIEVRKTAPKAPFRAFIYETLGIKKDTKVSNKSILGCPIYKRVHQGRGKVIGEFICDKVDFVAPWGIEDIPLFYSDKWVKEILKKACLTCDEAIAYQGNKSDIYAWHITALKIYDKPRELAEFYKPCGDCSKKDTMRCTEESTDCRVTTITRPPQSWQYIEEEK